MARSVEDLELFFKAVLEKRPWERDITSLPIPFRPFRFPEGKRRVGYYEFDGFIRVRQN